MTWEICYNGTSLLTYTRTAGRERKAPGSLYSIGGDELRQHFRHLLCFSLAVLLLIGGGAAFFLDDREEFCQRQIFPPAPYVIELPPSVYEEREEPTGRYSAIGEEMTDEERALSALMIYHEARGESEEGQREFAEWKAQQEKDKKKQF